MIRQSMLLGMAALLLGVAGAQADVYDFSYVGVNNPGVWGSGTFTTGTPYGDGYVPILSITGTTEAGAITGLESAAGLGIDPSSPNAPLQCCFVGPGGTFFYYDNAFKTGSPGPFSSNGLLFDVAAGNGVTGFPTSPINLFGDGDTYEFSYGEDVAVNSPPAYGGTKIRFTATATPEPSFYGAVALCMSGLLFARWRRRRS